jgi:hypothetical protein
VRVKPIPFLDLANYAYDAGFRGENHAIAVALAQPESNRIPNAANLQDVNGGSFGVLQINGAHDPDAEGIYPNMIPTVAWIQKMYEPGENYKAAWRIFKDNGDTFNPWGAFTSGLHKPSLDAAKVALDGSARLRAANARVAQYKAERDRISVAHDDLKIENALLNAKIAAAVAALA